MSTRTHQIELSDELERKLRERAAAAGTDADTFIVQTIEEKLQAPKSFQEIFAPLQDALADSGETPESLDQTFQDLLKSVRTSRRIKAS